MKIVIQRVNEARVSINGTIYGEIGQGLLLLVGVAAHDKLDDIEYMADKCVNMRIFQDDNGKMNLSLLEVKGEILVISQFTLIAQTRRGRRPSFIEAADPVKGNEYYQYFIDRLAEKGVKVKSGVFGAMMDVQLTNTGPVTIVIDSKESRKQ